MIFGSKEAITERCYLSPPWKKGKLVTLDPYRVLVYRLRAPSTEQQTGTSLESVVESFLCTRRE